MSPNGKFVLGGGEKPGSGEWADFIWEVGRETRWIPVPPGFEFNEPKSVSDDGQVGGESLRPPKYAIWVWDSKEGFTIFGKEPVLSGPWCSGDGNAVAFTDTSGTYRWTLASGLRKLENLKPSGPTWPESMLNPLSTAKAISSDGSVVVGNSDPIKDLGDAIGPQTGIHPLPAMPQVCVWGLVGEPKGLGRPLESRGAYPLACSADGKSICGYDVTSNGGRAFLWTIADGFRFLSLPAGIEKGSTSGATGMSADGRVVFGYAGSYDEGSATIWVDGKPELFTAFLTRHWLRLPHSDPGHIMGVSKNGRVFVGAFRGANSGSWLVRLSTNP